MYEIRPETLKTFVEDSNIKLPRFQRKQTWDDKKNFELCISLFKEYPIGVTILNIEKSEGKTTRWLLDGRQRRNALNLFYNDPESVYNWSRKFIGFKNNDQPAEIENKFWEKISEYLEDEDDENNEDENSNLLSDDPNENTSEVEETINEYKTNLGGLNLLLHIIKLTHNKSKKYNGFTRPFDFLDFTSTLPYLEINGGNKYLNSRKVKSFIKEYKNYCLDDYLDYQEHKSFSKFCLNRLNISNEKRETFKSKIEKTWDSIFERIDILDKITNLYLNSKIGLIEVKDLKSTDSQKIFNIINSKGTKLTAVEILSAKPNWNKLLNSPTEVQKKFTDKLYSQIDVKADGVVKWDLPATILDRLEENKFFFKEITENKSDFEKKLTLGFKLLSGIIENGVKKEDIDNLGYNPNINWDIDYEIIINDLNTVSKMVLNASYFKFLRTYRFSMMNYLSDAIALNFLILLYKDWKRKGKPIGNDTSSKVFQKNAFILLDSLIYEYVTRQWRGSSDGLIARNINNLESQPNLFKNISKEKWKSLLNEIFEENSIEGVKITKKILEPILLHFYALKSITGPDSNYDLEIDHIIPQSLFKSSTLADKDYLQHNLFNLCILPKDENISKSNKRLVEITNEWLKKQITKFTFIEEDKFSYYSDISNIKDLRKTRSEIFIDAFEKIRENILLN